MIKLKKKLERYYIKENIEVSTTEDKEIKNRLYATWTSTTNRRKCKILRTVKLVLRKLKGKQGKDQCLHDRSFQKKSLTALIA